MFREMQRAVNMNRPFQSRLHCGHSTNNELVQRFWTQRNRTRWKEGKLEWCTPVGTTYGPHGVEIRDGGNPQEIGKVSWKQQLIYAEERWSKNWMRRNADLLRKGMKMFNVKFMRKEERRPWGKGKNKSSGIPLGEIKRWFRFWVTRTWSWIGCLEDGRYITKISGR